MEIRKDVLNALEQARQKKEIGAGLEAKVLLSANGTVAPLLQKYQRELADLFIVSQVSLQSGSDPMSVTVERAEGTKCDRCWKYTSDVGSRPDVHAAICAECAGEVERFLQ